MRNAMSLITLLFLLLWCPMAQADVPDEFVVRNHLEHEIQARVFTPYSDTQRQKAVQAFVKQLKGLDDDGLGDASLFSLVDENEIKARVTRFQAKLKALVSTYQESIRPILMGQIQHKQKDHVASLVLGELISLSFPSANNHKTGKPVIGLLHYKQDMSDSWFASQWVDAGILKNFPEWENESWLIQGIHMDVELMVLRQMHREYLQGAKPKRHAQVVVPSSVQVKAPPAKATVAQDKPALWPAHERMRKVQVFIRKLRKIDAEQDWVQLKNELSLLLEQYEQEIKPILVANVNLRRKDVGAQANKGDLTLLFLPNRDNHHTGKPLSGKFRYQKNVSNAWFDSKIETVGLLVEHPELAQDVVVQAALNMEQELETLKNEHRQYLESNTIKLVH